MNNLRLTRIEIITGLLAICFVLFATVPFFAKAQGADVSSCKQGGDRSCLFEDGTVGECTAFDNGFSCTPISGGIEKSPGAVVLPGGTGNTGAANSQSNIQTATRPPGKIIPCGGPDQEQCTFAYLVTLGNNIIDFLLYGFAAPFAVILFMWAGFLFMFQSNNPGEISRAKGIFWNVVIGFVLALAAFIIIKLVLAGLNVTIPSELKL